MPSLFGEFTTAEQDGFSFPKPIESLTETYRPRKIADFVGLGKQKAILDKLVANPRPCGLLFVGGTRDRQNHDGLCVCPRD